MNTGALIFAFNNECTDYVAMAAWNAKRIRRHLNIPVAIVTDAQPGPDTKDFDKVITTEPESGGSRWFEDYNSSVTWYNAGRTGAYNLSPWERTLVLDADYVVASDSLNTVLNSSVEFACYRTAISATSGLALDGLNSFGRYNLPMWWATVMIFGRNNTAQYIFQAMQMIRKNWTHYRDLYGIDQSTYRNDFALSIAIGIISGHTGRCTDIPWPMISAMPDTKVIMLDQDSWMFRFNDQHSKPKELMLAGCDFHAMGKYQLETAIEAA